MSNFYVCQHDAILSISAEFGLWFAGMVSDTVAEFHDDEGYSHKFDVGDLPPIINLTPHNITVRGIGTVQTSGVVLTVGTVEEPARQFLEVPVIVRALGSLRWNGIPTLNYSHYGEPGKTALDWLNESQVSVYLVSSMALEAVKDELPQKYHHRFFAPDTGKTAIREDGNVIAVTRLVGIL